MDLDFIFFPAPKEITSDHEQGQILWIPKYPLLYPSFQNYVPRRNKKQGIFFKSSEQDFEDDHFEIDEQTEQGLQPVPKFDWKPISNKARKGQIDDQNSPTFDSNDGTPDMQSKLQLLNQQSTEITTKKINLQRLSSNLYKDRIQRMGTSLVQSQPVITLPQVLLDENNKQQQIDVIEESPVEKLSPGKGQYQAIGHIPCMYIDSRVHSPNILIYFHANSEDITVSYGFLILLRDNLQISVIAVEYPGYGKYLNDVPTAESIQNDAEYVYNYLTKRLGYQEDRIVIFGRSIGSGPATYLASKYKAACLALMSPFTSLKAVVRDYIGSWAQFLVRQRFDNLENIAKVSIPTFILHGKQDDIIPYSQAEQLKSTCKYYQEKCKSLICTLHLADDMDHISYRLYKDLINPFTEFLLQIKYYQNSLHGPKLPTVLFHDPSSINE